MLLQGKYVPGMGHSDELAAAADASATWARLKGPGLTKSLAEAWADPAVQATMPQQALQHFAQKAQQVS